MQQPNRYTIKDYSSQNGTVSGNGLTFVQYAPKALYEKLVLAMSLYEDQAELRRLQQRVMRVDFSWKRSAEAYCDLYEEM